MEPYRNPTEKPPEPRPTGAERYLDALVSLLRAICLRFKEGRGP